MAFSAAELQKVSLSDYSNSSSHKAIAEYLVSDTDLKVPLIPSLHWEEATVQLQSPPFLLPPRPTELLPRLRLPSTRTLKMPSPPSAPLLVPLPTSPNLPSLPGPPSHRLSRLPRASQSLPAVSDVPAPLPRLRTRSPTPFRSPLEISKLVKPTRRS